MVVAEYVYYLFRNFNVVSASHLLTGSASTHLVNFDCHKEVGVLVGGSFKRYHHIKPPYCKRPSDRNNPEFLSRHVILLCITLASITLLDYILCIRMCCEPVEAMSVGFSHK